MTDDKRTAKDAIRRRANGGAHGTTPREAMEARRRVKLPRPKRR